MLPILCIRLNRPDVGGCDATESADMYQHLEAATTFTFKEQYLEDDGYRFLQSTDTVQYPQHHNPYDYRSHIK
jgi:hypothetical protein